MNQLQLELVNQLRKFRLEHIEPFMAEDDLEGRFRRDIFNRLGQLGVAKAPRPKCLEEDSLGYLDFTMALGEIAKEQCSYGVTLSVSTMVQNIIYANGDEEQKKLYLPPLASGEGIGAFCLSESCSGSDAQALQTRATKVHCKGEKGYCLNGRKMWVTSAGVAQTYLVMAREDDESISAFIVVEGTEGFSCGKREEKMGWRTSPTCEVVFEDCFIPEKSRLGHPGKGLQMALIGLNGGRINIGAIAVGLAERGLEEALRYSISRRQFGKAIFDFQGLQWMMADMATEIAAAKGLVERAAIAKDQNKEDRKLASMAKLKATDVAMKVTTDGVQILGGVGHTAEYPLERFMRDAKILQIVEGSNQIQKNVIAKELKRELER